MEATHYRVIRLKHDGMEPRGFTLQRPHGTPDYLLLHFQSPGRLWVNQKWVRMTPGQCILLPPDTPHGLSAETCDLVHDWMHFDFEGPDPFLQFALPVSRVFTLTEPGRVTDIIRTCEMELLLKEPHYEAMVNSELGVLMCMLSRQFAIDGPRLDDETPQHIALPFRQLRMEIWHKPHLPWSVSGMARELSLSRSRLAVLYHRYFGISPSQDIILARVERARYLLSGTTGTLEEVAEQCGYSNVFHFIRQFKAREGRTPGEYRIHPV